MEHFQPDALTISRNPEWADRRRFTEAVLDTGKPRTGWLSGSPRSAREEAGVASPAELDWDALERGRAPRRRGGSCSGDGAGGRRSSSRGGSAS